MYQTSSFKVLRTGLNRYFKMNRTLDIGHARFMRANMVFDGVQVKAKKTGKGVTHPTPHISDEDMKKMEATLMWTMSPSRTEKILQHCI